MLRHPFVVCNGSGEAETGSRLWNRVHGLAQVSALLTVALTRTGEECYEEAPVLWGAVPSLSTHKPRLSLRTVTGSGSLRGVSLKCVPCLPTQPHAV